MNYGMYLSAASLRVHEARMNVVANNLANVRTAGFKRDLALVSARPAATAGGGVPAELAVPVLDSLGGGLMPSPCYTDFSQGPMEATGQDLDLALRGDGFFAVLADGQKRYTRDGRLGRDAEGYLVTQTGQHRLLDDAGQPIRLPSGGAKVDVDGAGTIRCGDWSARLGIVRFDDPSASLSKAGGNTYALHGSAVELPADAAVCQGFVEGSGAEEFSGLIEMLDAQRAYDASAKMIHLTDGMLSRAVNDLARIAEEFREIVMAIQSLHTAATGLGALSTDIDVIANNLANVNTVAFKGSRANFEDLLYQQQQMLGVRSPQGVSNPLGLFVGLGTRISNTEFNFSQGGFQSTEVPTDLAISGDGFFKVQIQDDVGGGVGYTRAGNFMLNADRELVLANADGFRLIPPIQVPEEATSININAGGEVTVTVGDQQESLGTIELARFANPQGLEPIGGNIFIKTDSSGDAVEAVPGTDGLGVLRSGFLETSNVDPVSELVNLIKTQRAFELNSQVITTSNQMLQTITSLKY